MVRRSTARELGPRTAYAVWVGLGAAGVALAGTALLGESVSAPRAAFLLLILVGVAGLHQLETRA